MSRSVNREQVRRLIAEGAQVVEVLERRQYRMAHLPGAVHLPAWELSRDRAAGLDHDRPIVVYCLDTV